MLYFLCTGTVLLVDLAILAELQHVRVCQNAYWVFGVDEIGNLLLPRVEQRTVDAVKRSKASRQNFSTRHEIRAKTVFRF